MRLVAYISCIMVGSFLALSLGCGSGRDPVEVVIPPVLCVDFVPSEAPASGKVVTRLRADSTCDLAIVEIVGTDIDGVFAVATHIVYDRTAVVYSQMHTIGSALSRDGASLNVVEDDLAGEITIGVARNADDTVDLVGTQLLMTLLFLPFEQGTSDMAVQTPCLTDGEEEPQPLGDVSCSGGSFTVEPVS